MFTRLQQCKSNLKQTWKILYEALGKTKRNPMSDSFLITREEISDPKIIAESFNDFFINIGTTNIDNGEGGFQEYLPDQQPGNLKFHTITNNDTIRIINQLSLKHSSGHGEMSTALLKQIKSEIASSETLIMSQSLTT